MFVVLLSLSFQLNHLSPILFLFPQLHPQIFFSFLQEFLPSSSLLACPCSHIRKSCSLLKETDEQMTQQLLASVMEETNSCKVFLGTRRIWGSESFHHFICGKHCRSQGRRCLYLQDWCHWWKRVSQWWIMIRKAAGMRQYSRQSKQLALTAAEMGKPRETIG